MFLVGIIVMVNPVFEGNQRKLEYIGALS